MWAGAVAMTVSKADSADYVGRFCRTCVGIGAGTGKYALKGGSVLYAGSSGRALFSGEPPVGVSFRERRVRHRTVPPDLDLA